MFTTPLEREILSHFWVSCAPFPKDTPLTQAIINDFVEDGYLVRTGDEDHPIKCVDEALRPYMDALSSVPLPKKVWVIEWPSQSIKEAK